jgi:hypothetical protein
MNASRRTKGVHAMSLDTLWQTPQALLATRDMGGPSPALRASHRTPGMDTIAMNMLW